MSILWGQESQYSIQQLSMLKRARFWFNEEATNVAAFGRLQSRELEA